ncbi:MAG TPA: RidA family protein [Gaiellaceae bacterium]|jgi:enamine deaminase RidA (YjgF/YER057c/UK114 family)|nr:RidA family protein [Gaiellaceae bacterium]
MERRSISGTSPYEAIMGYSRAVVVGKNVYVAGTAPIPPDGSPPPEGSYEQTRLCFEIIGRALGQAGATFEHVVRTRVHVTSPEHFEGVARAHGEVFSEIRPVNTTVVTSLMDPAWTVEIDVDAVLP